MTALHWGEEGGGGIRLWKHYTGGRGEGDQAMTTLHWGEGGGGSGYDNTTLGGGRIRL